MYIPTVQWKHTRRCQSTKPPMQFFIIKEISEHEEDPNVQQLPLLLLLLLAMSTTTSPGKQLYSRNVLLSEHKEFSQPTEFFKIKKAHICRFPAKPMCLIFLLLCLDFVRHILKGLWGFFPDKFSCFFVSGLYLRLPHVTICGIKKACQKTSYCVG